MQRFKTDTLQSSVQSATLSPLPDASPPHDTVAMGQSLPERETGQEHELSSNHNVYHRLFSAASAPLHSFFPPCSLPHSFPLSGHDIQYVEFSASKVL